MKKTLQDKQKRSKAAKKPKATFPKTIVGIIGLVAITPILLYLAFLFIFRGRLYPGSSIANFDLSGYAFGEAIAAVDVLQRDFVSNQGLTVFVADDIHKQATSGAYPRFDFAETKVSYDPRFTITQSYINGRQGDLIDRVNAQFSTVSQGNSTNHLFSLDEDEFSLWMDEISALYDNPGAEPEIYIDESEQLVVAAGENGYLLDTETLISDIYDSLEKLTNDPIEAQFVIEENQVSQENVDQTKLRAEKFLDQTLTLILETDDYPDETWVLEGKDIISFLDFYGGFDQDQITEYVEGLRETVDRPAQNALFDFQDGRVVEFSPSLEGLTLDVPLSVAQIIQSLEDLEEGTEVESSSLAIRTLLPNTVTEEVNDLGIRELIGRGESTYRGSIPGRVHNVAHTAQRIHGILIPPETEFSFNETIGEVSAKTGYKSAYIISGGRTILGDGGGVCQDSTTLFRAVMDAGLPITQRKAHSYRVGYYEQNSKPGFDATVYAPSVDFKFVNDTSEHVLIQARADSDNLTLIVELYGTNDGRIAEVTNYQQWDAVPAPPPLYQDDPSLAPGVVKQIDWASPGLKVKFDYVVTKAGETHFEKTFHSNFKPWQAVYLRGV